MAEATQQPKVSEPLPGWAKAAFAVFGLVCGFVAYVVLTAPTDAERAASEAAAAKARLAAWEAKTQPAASEITVDDYRRSCRGIPDDIHKQRCEGKWVVWDVFVDEVRAADKIRVRTSFTAGMGFDAFLTAPAEWTKPLPDYRFSKLRLAGRIAAPHAVHDDIRDAAIVAWLPYTPAEEAYLKQAVAEASARRTEEAARSTAYDACMAALPGTTKFPSKIKCPSMLRAHFTPIEGGYGIIGTCDMMNPAGAQLPHTFFCTVEGGKVVKFTVRPGG